MKDIFSILNGKGYEIKEEDKEAIKKEIAENYKTIAEFDKKSKDILTKDDELKAKEDTIAEMKKQIETLEAGNKGIDDLKATIKRYEDEENARKEAAEKEKKIAGLKARFSNLKGERNYEGGDDGYAAKGVFDDWRKALDDETNTGKSDKEIYEAIVKDKTGIFANPNTRVDIPSANTNGGEDNKPKFKNFF
jgi:chromosome segregation ATPase